jgi:hypothetical protein
MFMRHIWTYSSEVIFVGTGLPLRRGYVRIRRSVRTRRSGLLGLVER